MRAVLALVLAALPTVAAADILHMADGTTREGRVVETNDKEVVVDVGRGDLSLRVRIPRGEVVRIEHKPTAHEELMADYVRRLAKARQGTADDWHALGAWCAQQRVLKLQAREAYERAIAVDPDHAAAHAALGHVKLNDTWMTRERAIRLLAPHAADVDAKARELAARKEAEEAKARAAEAQARLQEVEAQLAKLQQETQALRQRLATPPPPPPRPRVIYRPIIIHPPRKRPSPKGDPSHERHAPRRPSRRPATSTPAPATPPAETPKGKPGDE